VRAPEAEDLLNAIINLPDPEEARGAVSKDARSCAAAHGLPPL